MERRKDDGKYNCLMRWLSLILLVCAPVPVLAEDWRGSVRVVDGDTLAISDARLRLIAIDAPEGAQTCQNAQQRDYDCGREATRELERLIGGREVRCSGDKRDRYGRALVVCFTGEINLNAAMVRSGWAVTYLGHDFERDEAEARAAKRGLWGGTFQRPADWRKDHPR